MQRAEAEQDEITPDVSDEDTVSYLLQMLSIVLINLTQHADNNKPNRTRTDNQKTPHWRLLFGIVNLVIEFAKQGHHVVLAVKTAHSLFPNKLLAETMKDFPGGT